MIQKAKLHNRLGFVHRTQGESEAAISQYKLAIEELKNPGDLTEQPEQLQLELARSYYYLGHQIRPGFGPNALPPLFFGSEKATETSPNPNAADLDRAISLLKSMQTESATVEASQNHLLSLCYREIANDEWGRRTQADDLAHDNAIELLQRLMDDYPNETIYQFDLMQTLAEINVFESNMNFETLNQAQASLTKAIEIGDQLIELRPDFASFRIAVAHAYFKLATIDNKMAQLVNEDQRQALLDESEQLYRRAVFGQAYLVRRYPKKPIHRVWLARFCLSLAQCPNLQSRTEVQNRLVGRAITNLVNLTEEWKSTTEVQALCARLIH